ncbi:hypothetical protein BPUN_3400 [Candidatus Paraburkholderia kirkii]|nr:hypothetical protein BPUN_3400 [Candidatus Paraburkholderia kirkii]
MGRGFESLGAASAVRTCSLEVAEQTARDFRPDLILVFGSCMPSVSYYLGLKMAALDLGTCMAFWLHDDPYEFDVAGKIVPLADIIFSNDRWTVTHYEHPRVYHLPLAADRQAHFRTPATTKSRDVFFCGVGFPNRIVLLRDCQPVLSGLKVVVAGSEWPSDISFASNARIPNAELPDWCASSLVTLNLGRRFNLANSRFNLDASTPGPRTFEAAAAGTVQCMFVEGLEIQDYYDVQADEILLFDSPRELRRHVEMLRDDPQRAMSIALAAQGRTSRDHTYENRAARIVEIVASERLVSGSPLGASCLAPA